MLDLGKLKICLEKETSISARQACKDKDIIIITESPTFPDENQVPSIPPSARLSKSQWQAVAKDLICQNLTEILNLKPSPWKKCYLIYKLLTYTFYYREDPDGLCIMKHDMNPLRKKAMTAASIDELHKKNIKVCPKSQIASDELLSLEKQNAANAADINGAGLSREQWPNIRYLICKDTNEVLKKQSPWRQCYLRHDLSIYSFYFRQKPNALCIMENDRKKPLFAFEDESIYDELHERNIYICPKYIKDRAFKGSVPVLTEANCRSHSGCEIQFSPLHVCRRPSEKNSLGQCYQLEKGECLDLAHCTNVWKMEKSRKLQCSFSPPLSNVRKNALRKKTGNTAKIGKCGEQVCSAHWHCDEDQNYRCFLGPGHKGACRKLDLEGSGECLEREDCRDIYKLWCDFSGILTPKEVRKQRILNITEKAGKCKGCSSHNECIRSDKTKKRLRCLLKEKEFPALRDGICLNMKPNQCVVSSDCTGSAESYTCLFSHLSETEQVELGDQLGEVAALRKFGNCVDTRALGDVSPVPRVAVDVQMTYPDANIEEFSEQVESIKKKVKKSLAFVANQPEEVIQVSNLRGTNGSVIVDFTAQFLRLEKDTDYQQKVLTGIKANPERFSFGEQYALDVDSVSVQTTSVNKDDSASSVFSLKAVLVIGGVILICVFVVATKSAVKMYQRRHRQSHDRNRDVDRRHGANKHKAAKAMRAGDKREEDQQKHDKHRSNTEERKQDQLHQAAIQQKDQIISANKRPLSDKQRSLGPTNIQLTGSGQASKSPSQLNESYV